MFLILNKMQKNTLLLIDLSKNLDFEEKNKEYIYLNKGNVRLNNCKQIKLKDFGDLRKKIYIRQGSFWLGLVIPVIPSIIMMFFVLMTGDVNVLFYWMCSLCLWPIIGFVIGMSVVFVESFRAGGRVSAIIGLIVAVLVWLWVFSWLPDALRRSHSR